MEQPSHRRSDAWRWQRLQQRDRGDRGCFVYGVITTGIYCRPGCASRLPKRDNVRFFDDAEQAHRAGFRPCRRCRPQREEAPEAALMTALCRFIEQAEAPPTLETLAARAGLSPSHLQRRFKAAVGVSPRAYGQQVHRHESYAQGGKRGNTMDIDYAFGRCRLGTFVVATSPRGICALELGDDEETLEAGLARRFPRARLQVAADAFAQALDEIAAYLDRQRPTLPLPLDIQGTAFQQQVWEALQAIPAGQTCSYAELAKALGKPQAVRAVAGACAANKIAVAIPCHRVVRSDGGLSGYRWGVARKWALLTAERHVADKDD